MAEPSAERPKISFERVRSSIDDSGAAVDSILDAADKLHDGINTDHLTGLSNLAGLELGLRTIVEKRIDEHSRVAIVFIDLDKFKDINDTFGYNAGDEALTKFADMLRDLFKRKEDLLSVVSRWGGDEFVLCIPYDEIHSGKDRRTQADVSSVVEQSIRDRLNIALQSGELPDFMVGMTATVGAEIFDSQDLKGDLGDFLQKAKDKVQDRKRDRQ